MRVLAIAVALVIASSLGLLGCDFDGYDNNDLELVTTYTAHQLCSCLWAMEQSEDYCRAWTKASPQVSIAKIDMEEKQVDVRALLLWQGIAEWDEAHGTCVMVE